MDQRATESSRLFGPGEPSDVLADVLGTLLRAPVRDIPTVEDWQREQGHIGVPTEEQSSREVGRNTLDYLTMAHGLANLLKSGGAGVQELMGKGRGAETFGKEMMDTSRRAQRGFSRKQEERPGGDYTQRYGELPEDARIIEQGRYGHGESMPPAEQPKWTPGARRPADAVSQDTVRVPIESGGTRAVNAFKIGEPVALPGDRQAQYVVTPYETTGRAPMWQVQLYDGERLYYVQTVGTTGEALAKARQLQNRLALAGKDLERHIEAPTATASTRRFRLPWERSSSPDARQSGGEMLPWRLDYQSPPQSGRWSQGATFYDE